MEHTPLISVIIPNYDHAEFLRQRIETVLNQTYSHIEVIILDDASSDGSVSIIKEYVSHPLVKIVSLNERNSGSPFLQWKKGVGLATGDWVWIAESDDYADPHFLEEMVNSVAGNSTVGLAYCDSYIVNDKVVTAHTFAGIKNARYSCSRWSSNHMNNGIRELEDYVLMAGIIHNTSAAIFRRSVLLKVNPFDIPMRYLGDKYAFVKTLSESDVSYVAKPLNFYRNPFTKKPKDLPLSNFYEQFLIFDWVKRHVPEINDRKFLNAFRTNTRNSLIRNWNWAKLSIYGRLLKINPLLMARCLAYNLVTAINSRLY